MLRVYQFGCFVQIIVIQNVVWVNLKVFGDLKLSMLTFLDAE